MAPSKWLGPNSSVSTNSSGRVSAHATILGKWWRTRGRATTAWMWMSARSFQAATHDSARSASKTGSVSLCSRSSGQRQTVEPEERQLVPIASLERDLAVDNVKEAAASQSIRIAPFEDRPFAVFE